MLEWSIELLEPIYEEIVHAYYGTILVVDNDGKLIYGRRPLESKLDVDEETLVGRTIFDLEAEGIFSDTATSEALRSGQRAVRLVKGSAGPPLLAIATPIKDKMDNTSMVVTFSQDEELTLLTLQRFQEERDKSVQLASYLSQKPGRSTVISESPLTKAVLEALDKVAPTDATVLFIGETGTGKEVFSRYVHRKSSRRDEPFIPVNCSAIPADLIESELFGYAKGAFTGANKDGKSGLFELAERGTLFLDEIGELSLLAQSKVLRVLETGDIQKVGSEQTLHTNVRIIAATNRDLLQMVNEGKFRKDLYYRL
ncbi:MAG: sigma-54 factor interaction domain-containing protein, partial [Oscillospiraceae bacterium]